MYHVFFYGLNAGKDYRVVLPQYALVHPLDVRTVTTQEGFWASPSYPLDLGDTVVLMRS